MNPVLQASPARYSDQPIGWRIRATALGSIFLSSGAVLAALLIVFSAVQPLVSAPPPIVAVTLQPLAAPPEPVQEVPEGPEQVEQKEQLQEREEQPEPLEIVPLRLAPLAIPTPPPAAPAKAADPVPETTAPKTVPAPPARQMSSNSEASWETLLLSHLEKHRRYPATAKGRAGVAYVSFRMNRQGQVLSASIARSSGSTALDRAALDTVRRAQPLPAIPADRPDVLELSVPVEFFVRR